MERKIIQCKQMLLWKGWLPENQIVEINENYNQFIFTWPLEMTKVLRIQISKLVKLVLTDKMYVEINSNLQYLE